MQQRAVKMSKYLSKYLRHAPHELGLTPQHPLPFREERPEYMAIGDTELDGTGWNSHNSPCATRQGTTLWGTIDDAFN